MAIGISGWMVLQRLSRDRYVTSTGMIMKTSFYGYKTKRVGSAFNYWKLASDGFLFTFPF
jgi:hypothetical protein